MANERKQRRKKTYGNVRNRGLCRRVVDQIHEKKAKKTYIIPAKTQCEVRQVGTEEWRKHQTKKEVTCHGYLWRDRADFCFAAEGYEIKVRSGRFRRADRV